MAHIKAPISTPPLFKQLWPTFPAGNNMFKINNRNTRTRCEICSKLTIETLEQDVKYVQS